MTRSSKRGCSVLRPNPHASGINVNNAIRNLTPVNETASGIPCQFEWQTCATWNAFSEALSFSMIEVRYDRGVYLPAHDLWLDPWEAKRFAFVSHAHSDHIAPHEEIILSERTACLLQARMPGTRTEHILPFGEQHRVHDAHAKCADQAQAQRDPVKQRIEEHVPEHRHQ